MEEIVEDAMQAMQLEHVNHGEHDQQMVPQHPSVVSTVQVGEESWLPLVNRQTLMELKVETLISNPQVMHDMLFDPSIRLKPNTHRRSSEEYLLASAKYWERVTAELNERHPSHPMPLLTALLTEIREMILELYPESSEITGEFSQLMDVPVLVACIRQAQRVSLAEVIPLITPLIRKNCSARRDGLLHVMEELANQGKVVECLRLCIDLCELMKLDLVNYSLSKERQNYAQVYIEREQALIQTTKITERWIKSQTGTPKAAFIQGLITLLSSPIESKELPETLLLDQIRISHLRAELKGLVFVGHVLLLCKQVDKDAVDREIINCVKLSLTNGGWNTPKIIQSLSDLLERDASPFVNPQPQETPIGRIIRDRLIQALTVTLKWEKGDPNFLSKLGLDALKGEVAKWLSDCRKLSIMNWKVHGTLYTQMYK